ncbi:hypothetical protein TA3x_004866 [Tundrisphaera sp. TA3]|uniref:hypothetical protein n=1 Tax=Tundrisphaera sp. TA3 TaxID=3435775 RepID=UPI003EC0010F
MNKLEVPCPSCGSLEVVVGDRAESPARSPIGDAEKSFVPRVHRCACRDCRHNFQHDFAFSL